MNPRIPTLLTVVAFLPTVAQAATITSIAQLNALTPDLSVTTGSTFPTPGSPNDTSDFTFQFTFTTPTTLAADLLIVDLGGSNGTSLKLRNDRLIFRSGVSGGALMWVASNALAASTQYNVIGSLFNSPDNTGDFMQLYLNEAGGVDPTYDYNGDTTGVFYDPDDTVNDFGVPMAVDMALLMGVIIRSETPLVPELVQLPILRPPTEHWIRIWIYSMAPTSLFPSHPHSRSWLPDWGGCFASVAGK